MTRALATSHVDWVHAELVAKKTVAEKVAEKVATKAADKSVAKRTPVAAGFDDRDRFLDRLLWAGITAIF